MNQTDTKGRKHGPWKTYWATKPGQVHCECSWKNGKLHGPFKDFWRDGTLCSTRFYVYGRSIGITTPYVNGKPTRELYKIT